MRRMYSEKGIIDTVNKGIQEGEISAGGLTPEQEAVLDQMSYDAEGDALITTTNDFQICDNTESGNVLMDFYLDEENYKANINSDYTINLESNTGVTVNDQNVLLAPASAPADQQLVGIDTSGAQNAVSLSNTFSVDANNKLGLNFVGGSFTPSNFKIMLLDDVAGSSSYQKVRLTDTLEGSNGYAGFKINNYGASFGSKHGRYSGVLFDRGGSSLTGYDANKSYFCVMGQSVGLPQGGSSDGGNGLAGTRRLGFGYIGYSGTGNDVPGGFGFISTSVPVDAQRTAVNILPNKLIVIPNTENYTAPHTLATIEDIAEKVPDAPTTDGTYVLKVVVTSGVPSYQWVSA